MPAKRRDHDLISEVVQKTIRDLIHGRRPWPLLLQGGAGSGKTCAAMVLVDRSGASIYVKMIDLSTAISDAQFGRIPFLKYGGQRTRSEAELWEGWIACNVAVLDEIGSREKVSGHAYDVLLEAVNLRIDAERPLVVITNLNQKALAAVYDDRLASRLNSGTILELSGDRRR